MMDERRRFERVTIADNARINVADAKGKKLGPVKILSRGGMLFTSETKFTSGSKVTLYICDDIEGIAREVQGVVRYHTSEGVGVEFDKLDTDAAVEIGVWIGKFYATRH